MHTGTHSLKQTHTHAHINANTHTESHTDTHRRAHTHQLLPLPTSLHNFTHLICMFLFPIRAFNVQGDGRELEMIYDGKRRTDCHT